MRELEAALTAIERLTLVENRPEDAASRRAWSDISTVTRLVANTLRAVAPVR